MSSARLLYCLLLASAAMVAPASDKANEPMWAQNSNSTPEAINGQLGSTIISADDTLLDIQNPDMVAPPSTDAGSTGNAKWSFSLSHNRIQSGGWARQQNLDVMPLATAMASVNMRLAAGAIRELHWHSTAEGSTVVTSVNTDGQVFVDKVNEGDLWYFPAGIPHSLQATDDDPSGTEFLLVFDNGAFSEDSTFLLTDWTAHIPKEVLSKNFQVNISAFDNIPSEQLYIFPAGEMSKAPSSPEGYVPSNFTYKLSQQSAIPCSGGSIKIFDTSAFPVANTIVGALVTWHPTEPEWDYVLAGEGRMTLFASVCQRKDFRLSRYVPPSYGHYMENTGNTTLQFLEIFNSCVLIRDSTIDKVEDMSLRQWLALTPSALVKDHLGVDDSFVASLNKTKQYVVGPSN
ncbi:oxalate decarboxylase [Phellopilus nigrolimitatus]|nr:oxalate decarboxylase [Phellopilus nigrolimitatus]